MRALIIMGTDLPLPPRVHLSELILRRLGVLPFVTVVCRATSTSRPSGFLYCFSLHGCTNYSFYPRDIFVSVCLFVLVLHPKASIECSGRLRKENKATKVKTHTNGDYRSRPQHLSFFFLRRGRGGGGGGDMPRLISSPKRRDRW